jgi:hypothetical protein
MDISCISYTDPKQQYFLMIDNSYPLVGLDQSPTLLG